MAKLLMGTMLETNKGKYKFRYATGGDAFGSPVRLVMNVGARQGPFDGEFGDEIPYNDEGIKKYGVKFKI